MVDVRIPDRSAVAGDALDATGASLVAMDPAGTRATVSVPTARLADLATLPGLISAQEVLTPQVAGPGLVGRPRQQRPTTNAATCPTGVVSGGDTQLRASIARASQSVDGTGVKVGVLSDSYAALSGGVAADIASGDLPGAANPCGYTTPVTVLSDYNSSGGTDEGRAMLQIVHDLAPGAQLLFASAFNGETDFANKIRALQAAGATVIVDDVSYFDEPMYQDGPVAKAINDVTAAGASYFTSAGNDHWTTGGKAVGSYEAPAYRPTACPSDVLAAASSLTSCHSFNPIGTDNDDLITVPNGGSISPILGWSEPWAGVTTNLNLYVVRVSNGAITKSQNTNTTTGTPYEFVDVTNNSGSSQQYRVVIGKVGSGGGTPRLKIVFSRSNFSAVEWNTSANGDVVGPTIFGHSAAQAAESTAAVPASNSGTVEYFSSRGPAQACWAPYTGTAAAALPSCTTKTIDLAATDGVATTVSGFSSFYGTSAAAPHAAAVAALMRQKRPCRSQAAIDAAIEGSGRAISGFGTNDIGAGLIDAQAAITGLTACAAPGAPGTPTATAGNASATVSWTAPSSIGDGAVTGYVVTPYLGATAQPASTFDASTTTRTITGLTNGSTYTFQVQAVNAYGTGTASAASNAVIPTAPASAPGAPTGVSATAGNAAATVSWSAPPSDGGSVVTGYVITPYLGATAQPAWTFDASTTTRTITGLTNGSTYTFKVAAVNAIGTGPASAASDPVTPTAPATAPGPPTGVSATPGDGSATVSWTAPASNGGSAITGYVVTPYVGSTAQPTSSFDASTTSRTISGLSNGTAYTFSVAAVNAVGTGASSAPSTAVTPRTVPGAPTGVTATAGNGSATVSWTAPASNGGSALTGYLVTPYVGTTAQPASTFDATTTTRTITGLTNGAPVTFTVAAVNVAGTGSASAPSTAVTPQAPWAPFASWDAFVTWTYQRLLGRAPTASEQTAKVGALTAGSLSKGQLVADLRTDADQTGKVDPVARLYRAYFLRIPDAGGLTYWIGQRRAGKALDVISASFAGSSEFKSRYGTLSNRGFVQLVYQNVLGRPGEASGVDYWTGQLDAKKKTRGQVMVGFSESTEHRNRQAAATTVDVLYVLLLGRAPSADEHDTAVAALGSGGTVAQLAADLLGRPEVAARL